MKCSERTFVNLQKSAWRLALLDGHALLNLDTDK
jgi:hypothetical protein